MRLHGDRECDDRRVFHADGSPALFTGGNNEVWSFGEANEKILTSYIFLRELMRPYTRKLMEEAHLYGKPVMRPMFYDFPEQDICWDLKEQYMFGSSILVAPFYMKIRLNVLFICHLAINGLFSLMVPYMKAVKRYM